MSLIVWLTFSQDLLGENRCGFIYTIELASMFSRSLRGADGQKRAKLSVQHFETFSKKKPRKSKTLQYESYGSSGLVRITSVSHIWWHRRRMQRLLSRIRPHLSEKSSWTRRCLPPTLAPCKRQLYHLPNKTSSAEDVFYSNRIVHHRGICRLFKIIFSEADHCWLCT